MTVPHQQKRLPGPDIVRAVAIVLVVLAHTSGMWRTGHTPVTSAYFSSMLWSAAAPSAVNNAAALLPRGKAWVPAAVGVELFFILSGYLIGSLLIKTIVAQSGFSFLHLRRFLFRRWLRTLPAYWLILSLLIPIWLLFLKKKLTWSVLLYFVFLQNMATPHPAFFSVAWSLSVEEWFYCILALVFCLASATKHRSSISQWIICWLLIYMAIAIIIRMSIAAKLPQGADMDKGIRKLVIARLDAPMYGVLMAWFMQFKPSILRYKSQLVIVSITVTLGLTTLMYYLEPGGRHTGHWLYLPFNCVLVYTLLPMGLALCLPAAVVYTAPKYDRTTRVYTHIARISYSLYLTHNYVYHVLPFSRVHFASVWAQLLYYAIYLAVTGLIATALYYLVEQPFMRLRDRILPAETNPSHTTTV